MQVGSIVSHKLTPGRYEIRTISKGVATLWDLDGEKCKCGCDRERQIVVAKVENLVKQEQLKLF